MQQRGEETHWVVPVATVVVPVVVVVVASGVGLVVAVSALPTVGEVPLATDVNVP